MKLVFAGSSFVSVESLKKIHANPDFEIVAVLTNPDQPKGRKKVPTPNPLKEYAIELKLNIIEDLITLRECVENGEILAEIGVAVAYGKIFKFDHLQLFQKGWINLHFSLLPKYRGPSPVQTAILSGERETGVTVFKIEEGLDDGDIIEQIKCKIPQNCTSDELFEILSEIGADVLNNSLISLKNNAANFQKQTGEPTFTTKLDKANAKIDWNNSPLEIVRKINAYSSNPGAWFEVTQIDKPILRVIALKSQIDDKGAVELLRVKPAGKNAMNFSDFVRGIKGEYKII